MKEEIKDRWVEALRSGKYKQGRKVLKKGKNFCCLGVLCDITKDELGLEWNARIPASDSLDGERLFLPLSVKDYAGLSARNPGVGVKALSDMNDTGVKFNRIADLIEKHWEEL